MPKIIKVGCSEYRAYYLCDDKKVYASVWDGSVAASRTLPYPPIGVVDVAGGQYQGVAIDGLGYAWTLSNNAPSGTQVKVDAAGQAFTGNATCYAYNGSNFTVKQDGTVWAWGSNDYKFPGVGAAPIQISPKGLAFAKIVTGGTLLGLTTSGDVYEWATGNIIPAKKVLPGAASDIFGSYNNFKGAIVGGNPYAWGNLNFISTINSTTTTPTNLQQIWGLTTGITKVVASWNTLHFIDKNGDLYGVGDNAQGEVGNGYEKVNKAALVPNPYVWDWKLFGGPMVLKPVKIASAIADVYTGNSYVFYHYAIGTDGGIYSWGRTKSVVLGNGKAANNESAFPNAFDVLVPTKVDPMTALGRGVDFSVYAINAGADQSITSGTTKLSGSAKAATGYTIKSLVWSQVSGVAVKIQDNGDGTANISGLTTGKYIFKLGMTDNNTGEVSDMANIDVAIPLNHPPVADAGLDQIITLPTNTALLDSSKSADPDGDGLSFAWSKVSGPCGDTLSDPTAVNPTLTVSQAGTYLYSLTTTDVAGAATSDTVQILVNPVPYITKVDIHYSDGRIVTQ